MSEAEQRHGFAALREWLAARSIKHALVEHPDTYTAAAEARIAAVAPDHAAKAVMTRDEDSYLLAVIPASELLDLRKLRRVTARPGLRLASEAELAADFPAFDLGALPPFGELLGCTEVLDGRLVTAGRVLCNGGDHRHSIVIDAAELRASTAHIADLVDDVNRHENPGRPSAR
jgi:Ala-tRNA(Pro) deacylase